MNNLSRDQLLNINDNEILAVDTTDVLEVNENHRATVRLKDIDNLRQTANNLLKADKQLCYDEQTGETKGISFNEISSQLVPENLNLASITVEPKIRFSPDFDNVTTPNTESFLPAAGTLGISSVNVQTKPLERKIIDELSPANFHVGAESAYTLGYDSAIYSGIGEIAIKSLAINHGAEYIVTQQDVEVVGGKNEITLDLTEDGYYFGASQLSLSVPLVNNKVFTVNANTLGATLTPAGESVKLDGTPTSEGGYSPLGYREVTLKADLTQLAAASVVEKASKGGGVLAPGGLSIGYNRVSVPDISNLRINQNTVGIYTKQPTEGILNLMYLPSTPEDENATYTPLLPHYKAEDITSTDIFYYKDLKNIPVALYASTLSTGIQTNLVKDYYEALSEDDKAKADNGSLKKATTTYYDIYSCSNSDWALGKLSIPQIPIKTLNINAIDKEIENGIVVNNIANSITDFNETIQNHSDIDNLIGAINDFNTWTTTFNVKATPRSFKSLTIDLKDRTHIPTITLTPSVTSKQTRYITADGLVTDICPWDLVPDVETGIIPGYDSKTSKILAGVELILQPEDMPSTVEYDIGNLSTSPAGRGCVFYPSSSPSDGIVITLRDDSYGRDFVDDSYTDLMEIRHQIYFTSATLDGNATCTCYTDSILPTSVRFTILASGFYGTETKSYQRHEYTGKFNTGTSTTASTFYGTSKSPTFTLSSAGISRDGKEIDIDFDGDEDTGASVVWSNPTFLHGVKTLGELINMYKNGHVIIYLEPHYDS